MSDATKIPHSTKEAAEIYLDGTYLFNNPAWHSEDSPWKAEQIHRIISNNDISPDTVCEVGCGAGEILRQLSLKMTASKFLGYELSPQAFELCKTRESERVKYSLKNIVEEDVFFDILLCIDVFEHVEDYIGFIRSIKSKANYKIFHIPIDISVLSVLRGRMMTMRQSAGHIHYFTPATAIATLKDCGYEIIDYFYTKVFDDLPDITFKGTMAKIPRKFMYAISPDLMVKLLGGCSLIVLSR
jgi:hypothetical protein